jgi:hypothetical protein
MIDNMSEIDFEYFGMLVLGNARGGRGVGWGVLLVMQSSLHGVVNFSGL